MGLRQERMADEVRDTLARIFTGGQLSDPRLKGVTISAVKMTGDLQMASVYFRTYGTDQQSVLEAQRGLESASAFLRRQIADAIRDVRRVPTLRFFYDESIERGSRIEELLSKL
jgi:ribosome-binding factor A